MREATLSLLWSLAAFWGIVTLVLWDISRPTKKDKK